MQVGGTSEKQKKKVFFFCFSLGLHYLCRHNYYIKKLTTKLYGNNNYY